MCHFELHFEHNYDLTFVFYVGKTEVDSVLPVGCHLLMHMLGVHAYCRCMASNMQHFLLQ